MTLIRYLCLLVPIAAILAAARADRSRAARAGALLAFIGAAVGIAALHELARLTGWWRFAEVDGSFRGMPVDLWLGWSALWGPVPVLLRRFVPVPAALAALAWFDLLAMPRMEPLVHLGSGWLWGEALGLLAVALPAQLAGRWSAQRRRLGPRVLLQMGIFSAMAMWLVPHTAFELGDGSWQRILAQPRPILLVAAQVALLVATPALSAVIEFARRGNGTPYPWDCPDRLITTGPYAYVANPMQASMVLLLLLMAGLAGSWVLVAAAICGAVFSAAVAAVHERDQLSARFGQRWRAYRSEVRDWLPRLRPYPGVAATLWLDDQCGPCSVVRGQLARRGLTGLDLAAAHDHERVLWSARYEAADGHTEHGVAAVARGMEHAHLGWAYLGWLLRLPGLNQLAQLVSDAFIVPPHPARGEGDRCRTPNSGSLKAP